VDVVDSATGQRIVKLSAEFAQPKRKRYYFPWGFCFMGMDYHSTLAHTPLSGQAHQLLHLLIETAGYGGICAKPHSYYGDVLGVDKSRVSKLLTLLERLNILRRLGGRSLLLCPTFFHMGTPEQQAVVLDHWTQVTDPFEVGQVSSGSGQAFSSPSADASSRAPSSARSPRIAVQRSQA